MAAFNKCMFIGNVGQDPSVHQFDNGSVANFSLAVTEKYTDRNGQSQERTEWVSIQASGKLVDVISQYVSKGTTLFCETKMRTRKYTDQNGVERSITEFLLNSMQILSHPQNQPQNQPQQGYAQPSYQAPVQPQTSDPYAPGYQPQGVMARARQQQAQSAQRQQNYPPQQQYSGSLEPQVDDLPF